MEHRRGDERGQCRRDQTGDRDDDPEEDEVRDGPRPVFFPGEGMLAPDRFQVRGATARLCRLIVVEDVLRHPDEDVTSRRGDEPQNPLTRRRFAAAAFSYEAEDLPPPDVEVDPVDRTHVLRRGPPQGREESLALLEPHPEIAQDQVRLAGHLTSPPSAAASWCSSGTRRSGLRRRDRGPAPGRHTAAKRTYIADGSGSRPAGWTQRGKGPGCTPAGSAGPRVPGTRRSGVWCTGVSRSCRRPAHSPARRSSRRT